MIIEISSVSIPSTLEGQKNKTVEEAAEFFLALMKDQDPGHIAEEWFDFIKASSTLLVMKGIDLKEANRKHLAKMRKRELMASAYKAQRQHLKEMRQKGVIR